MKHLFVLAALLGFGATASAQVLRCVDAAGGVSYTDQRCPSNTRSAEQVLGAEATAPQPPPPPPRDAVRQEAPRRAPVEPATVTAPPPPAPGGLIVLDPRASDRTEAQQRELERQRREAEYMRDDPGYPSGYPYPGYRPPVSRPQDMRPQLRGCDATGCHDTQGNTYNRAGKLDRYQGIDGRTCRPVGTTTICQ